jgi:hypothetical protein
LAKVILMLAQMFVFGASAASRSFFMQRSRAGLAITPDSSSVKRVLHPASFNAVCYMAAF